MRRLAVPVLLLLLAPVAVRAAAAQEAAPRLEYRMDGYRDDKVTYDSVPNSYRGRWVGTWYGADGSRYSGTYEGDFSGNTNGRDLAQGSTASPPVTYYEPADPALYGSGLVVNGWYYPPVVETRTVIEYLPAR